MQHESHSQKDFLQSGKGGKLCSLDVRIVTLFSSRWNVISTDYFHLALLFNGPLKHESVSEDPLKFHPFSADIESRQVQNEFLDNERRDFNFPKGKLIGFCRFHFQQIEMWKFIDKTRRVLHNEMQFIVRDSNDCWWRLMLHVLSCACPTNLTTVVECSECMIRISQKKPNQWVWKV